MATTTIEWTARKKADGTTAPGYTFNPWWGCEKVSPACKHCYAEKLAGRTEGGSGLWGVGSRRRFFHDNHWLDPVRWNETAVRQKQRRSVFCASMGDWLEDRQDLIEPRRRLCQLMQDTPMLDWLTLTKRPENVERLTPPRWRTAGWTEFPENVWIGFSAGNQRELELGNTTLIRTLAPSVRRRTFVSLEPLLNAVDIKMAGGLAWFIVGGESGVPSRPCYLDWIEWVVTDARILGKPVFVKQLGSHVVASRRQLNLMRPKRWKQDTDYLNDYGRVTLNDFKGIDWNEWPESVRVRQLPDAFHVPPSPFQQEIPC